MDDSRRAELKALLKQKEADLFEARVRRGRAKNERQKWDDRVVAAERDIASHVEAIDKIGDIFEADAC